jgi:predicted DNA-binding protein (MmcQ/YjbR family)
MNKIHWVTVVIDGSVSDSLLKQWIDASYQLIVSGFSRKEKLLFAELSGKL